MIQEYENRIEEIKNTITDVTKVDQKKKPLFTEESLEGLPERQQVLIWELALSSLIDPISIGIVGEIFQKLTKMGVDGVQEDLIPKLQQHDAVLSEWEMPEGMRSRLTVDCVLAITATGMRPTIEVHKLKGKPKASEVSKYFEAFYESLPKSFLCAPVPVFQRDEDAIGVTMYVKQPST